MDSKSPNNKNTVSLCDASTASASASSPELKSIDLECSVEDMDFNNNNNNSNKPLIVDAENILSKQPDEDLSKQNESDKQVSSAKHVETESEISHMVNRLVDKSIDDGISTIIDQKIVNSDIYNNSVNDTELNLDDDIDDVDYVDEENHLEGKKNNRKRNHNRNKQNQQQKNIEKSSSGNSNKNQVIGEQSKTSKLASATSTTTSSATTCPKSAHKNSNPVDVGKITSTTKKSTDIENSTDEATTLKEEISNQVKLDSVSPNSTTNTSDLSSSSVLSSSNQPANFNDNDKMNGVKSYGSNHMNGANETNLCKICSKHVYHMEQIKACKGVFHKCCFRCVECNKQLNVDSYSSHEGLIYCKPHFKQLFQPKPNFDNSNGSNNTANCNGHQQAEPEDFATSISNTITNGKNDSKPQETFENLAVNLSNIRNRFENRSSSLSNNDSGSRRSLTSEKPITRSESIHKIMQKYQSRVAGDNYVSSSSDEEDNCIQTNETSNNGNEKMSFSGMSTLKSQWENGSINGNAKSEKETVQNELEQLRKKNKNSEPLKQVYERAIQEAKSTENLNKNEQVLLDSSIKAVSIKEKFEKGALEAETEEDRIERLRKEREAEMIQIARNDAALKEARNKFKQIEAGIGKDSVDGTTNSNGPIEDVSIDAEQLQQRFSYFENLNGNQAKDEDHVEHSSTKVADDIPKVDTTKKMLSKFKALEAGQVNGNVDLMNGSNSPKQPKRITPPPEVNKVYENEPLVERDPNIIKSSYKTDDVIQVKPEMARNLRAKFENWQTEIERENRKDDADNDFVPLERDATKNIRAMFENIQNEPSKPVDKPRPRVNRFVQDRTYVQNELCYVCNVRIYPMEKMEFSGIKLHKNCFRCHKCHMPLRLDNFTQHAEKLFCIPHFKQLFMEKGNYDEGFGLEQHKDKWSNKSSTCNSVNGTPVKTPSKNSISTTLNKVSATNGHNGHRHEEADADEVEVETENDISSDGNLIDSIEQEPQDFYQRSNSNGGQTLDVENY